MVASQYRAAIAGRQCLHRSIVSMEARGYCDLDPAKRGWEAVRDLPSPPQKSTLWTILSVVEVVYRGCDEPRRVGVSTVEGVQNISRQQTGEGSTCRRVAGMALCGSGLHVGEALPSLVGQARQHVMLPRHQRQGRVHGCCRSKGCNFTKRTCDRPCTTCVLHRSLTPLIQSATYLAIRLLQQYLLPQAQAQRRLRGLFYITTTGLNHIRSPWLRLATSVSRSMLEIPRPALAKNQRSKSFLPRRPRMLP